jgi:PAS domain S-box-containing protein
MRKQIRFLSIFLAIIIFLGDLLFPFDYHIEFLYCLVVLLTIWIPIRRLTFDVGITLTALIIIGHFSTHTDFSTSNEISSLIIPTACLWGFVYLVVLFKSEQDRSKTINEHLDAMFKNATQGIIISNTRGEMITINPNAEILFGYGVGEMEGMKIEQLIPERFARNHVGHRTKYYGEHRTRAMGSGLTLFGKRKDNSEFPIEISLSTFKNNDELYIISFIIDVTERKKQEDIIARTNEELEVRVKERTRELAASNENLKQEVEERIRVEDALRNSERLYSTIAHNFPDGMIVVMDRSYKRVFIDGKLLEQFGYTSEELTGKTIQEESFFPWTEEIKAKFDQVFEWKSTSFDIEINNRTYTVIAVPLPDVKGVIHNILLVIQDVTEIRSAANEILETLNKERELNELKSKFVSIASHEFRTPLSTILSSVALIEKYVNHEDSDKKAKHIERIKSSVKNLTEILNDFLSLEKLEAGKSEVNLTVFDVTLFAKDLCEQMQTLARENQEIIYEHHGSNLMITIDRQLLRNICINLINNAIKYSPEATPVEFITEINDDNFIIIVKDYGLGIPEEDQQHLFERFFRAKNVTAIQGTGLGLNIVTRYAGLLNGEITYKSKTGVGSEFTIKFPIFKLPNIINHGDENEDSTH